jgi:biopolymer transport protein ExbB/TolQ
MLIKIAVGGSTWVLLLLVILSILSIALIIEKSILYARWVRETRRLWEEMKKSFEGETPSEIENILQHNTTPITRIIRAGLRYLPEKEAMMEAIEAEKVIVHMEMEKRLAFLGTLGTNAPFIGLFGTVLGVIHAFKDLAITGSGGGSVMSGISEALVATGVGLWVAIPAAIFYNIFKKKSNDMMVYADSISHLMVGNFHKINSQRKIL